MSDDQIPNALPSLQEMAEALRQRLEGRFSVEVPDDDMLGICSEKFGMEFVIDTNANTIFVQTEIYVMCEAKETVFDEEGTPRDPEALRPYYLNDIRKLFEKNWSENGWDIGEEGEWFTASREEDGPDTLLGFGVPVELQVKDIDSLIEGISKAEEFEAWRLLDQAYGVGTE